MPCPAPTHRAPPGAPPPPAMARPVSPRTAGPCPPSPCAALGRRTSPDLRRASLDRLLSPRPATVSTASADSREAREFEEPPEGPCRRRRARGGGEGRALRCGRPGRRGAAREASGQGRRGDADDRDGARRASIVRRRSGAPGRPERRSRRGETTRARGDGAGGAARGRGGTRGMEDGGRLAGARARQHGGGPLPVAPGRWSRQWDAVATRSDMAATYPMRCCWRPSTDCRCRRPSSGERLHAGSGDASSPAHATFQQCLDTQIQVLSVSHYLCVLNIAVLPTLPEFLPTADLVRITSARALHKVEGLMMDDVATVKDEIK